MMFDWFLKHLGYEKALWPKKLVLSHASQILIVRFWFFFSYLINTVRKNWPIEITRQFILKQCKVRIILETEYFLELLLEVTTYEKMMLEVLCNTPHG